MSIMSLAIDPGLTDIHWNCGIKKEMLNNLLWQLPIFTN